MTNYGYQRVRVCWCECGCYCCIKSLNELHFGSSTCRMCQFSAAPRRRIRPEQASWHSAGLHSLAEFKTNFQRKEYKNRYYLLKKC